MDWLGIKVADIVVNYPATAKLLQQWRIDFYCNGEVTLADSLALQNRKDSITMQTLSDEQIVEALTHYHNQPACMPDFKKWPLELLVDYVTKYHHREIRSQGPELLLLVERVTEMESVKSPWLRALEALYKEALTELLVHLDKEDHILYPAIYHIVRREPMLPPPYFPSITIPIKEIQQEHEIEIAIFNQIARLTNYYQVLEESTDDHKAMLIGLKQFESALQEHIHLENNLIFPQVIEAEKVFPLA